MATKAIIARRELDATKSLTATMRELSDVLDVKPVEMRVRGKKPDWVQMRRMEILAGWAEQLVEPIQALQALAAKDFQAEVEAVRSALQTELDEVYRKRETAWAALEALLYEKTKADLVRVGVDYGLDLDVNDLKDTLVETLLVEFTGQQPVEVDTTIRVLCDRCQTEIEGLEIDGGTAGFYRVDGPPWDKYADEGEAVLCDECMQADPRYQADYGEPPEVTD